MLVPGVVLGAVPPCGRGVVIGPVDVPPVPMPDDVLPSVPGIAPVGLSTPGAGVDSIGRGGAGDADGSGDDGFAGGFEGVSPPRDVPGGVPGAAGGVPLTCASAGVATSTPSALTMSIPFNAAMANLLPSKTHEGGNGHARELARRCTIGLPTFQRKADLSWRHWTESRS